MLLSNPSTEFGFGAARTEFGSKKSCQSQEPSSWTADGNFTGHQYQSVPAGGRYVAWDLHVIK